MALLVSAMARQAAYAGAAAEASKRALRRQRGRWAEQPGPAAAPPGPAPSETAAELQGLARLRHAGLLTEQEFTAKKRQVLRI